MTVLNEALTACGFFQWGVVDTAQMGFSQEVRAMCQVNTCGKYGSTWACPPAVGSVEECRDRICRYDKFLVISGKYDLDDSFDFEGMIAGAKSFSRACHQFDASIKSYLKDYLMFSNEGCDLCTACTYPDAPCRFPDRVHGSLEGNGIFVNELAKLAGMNYHNGPNTVTYLGAMAFHSSELDARKRRNENG